MRILFDNGTPNPIARSLAGYEVAFARQIGWHELNNGELLRQAEEAQDCDCCASHQKSERSILKQAGLK